jgi:hypothetical protein
MKFTVRTAPHPERDAHIGGNTLGYNTVEIVQFNYDGNGGVIAIVDNELAYLTKQTLEFLIDGKWYSNDICSDAYAN